MEYKTYRINTFKKLDQFNRTFKPWKKWQDIKLTGMSPCKDCDVYKERIDNRYLYMMSEGSDKELVKRCRHCLEHTLWAMECIEKLKWYEERDERLQNEK